MGSVAAITALQQPASNKKRLRIYLDGEPYRTTNRRVVRALELSVGEEVDEQELASQLDDEERRQAREHALSFLTYRARSSVELEKRLREVGYGPAAVAETIKVLSAAGYLDDPSFAEQWIAERVRIKQYGRRRISAELVAKGIDPESAAEMLDACCPESGEAARAAALARRRLAGTVGLERLAAVRRVAPYLMRKGYSSAAVSGALRDALGEHDEARASGVDRG